MVIDLDLKIESRTSRIKTQDYEYFQKSPYRVTDRYSIDFYSRSSCT